MMPLSPKSALRLSSLLCALAAVSTVPASRADVLTLTSGKSVTGAIIAANRDKVIIETKGGIAVSYPATDIRKAAFDDPRLTLDACWALDARMKSALEAVRRDFDRQNVEAAVKALTEIIDQYRTAGMLWSDLAREACLWRARAFRQTDDVAAYFDLRYAKDSATSGVSAEASKLLKQVELYDTLVTCDLAKDTPDPDAGVLCVSLKAPPPSVRYFALLSDDKPVFISTEPVRELSLVTERKRYGRVSVTGLCSLKRPTDTHPVVTAQVGGSPHGQVVYIVAFRMSERKGQMVFEWDRKPPYPIGLESVALHDTETKSRIAAIEKQTATERTASEQKQAQAQREREQRELAAKEARDRAQEEERRKAAELLKGPWGTAVDLNDTQWYMYLKAPSATLLRARFSGTQVSNNVGVKCDLCVQKVRYDAPSSSAEVLVAFSLFGLPGLEGGPGFVDATTGLLVLRCEPRQAQMIQNEVMNGSYQLDVLFSVADITESSIAGYKGQVKLVTMRVQNWRILGP